MDNTVERTTEETVFEQPFLIGDLERHVRRNRKTIYRLEAQGKLQAPARDSSGRRIYTRAQVDEITRFFETEAHPSTKAS